MLNEFSNLFIGLLGGALSWLIRRTVRRYERLEKDNEVTKRQLERICWEIGLTPLARSEDD